MSVIFWLILGYGIEVSFRRLVIEFIFFLIFVTLSKRYRNKGYRNCYACGRYLTIESYLNDKLKGWLNCKQKTETPHHLMSVGFVFIRATIVYKFVTKF